MLNKILINIKDFIAYLGIILSIYPKVKYNLDKDNLSDEEKK